MKENFDLLCKIVSRTSIRAWEEWVEGFSNLFNKTLYDLKPRVALSPKLQHSNFPFNSIPFYSIKYAKSQQYQRL